MIPEDSREGDDDRDAKCVQMRRAEIDWETIVQELGYSSRSHAYDCFVAFMRRYPREDVEQMRDLELQRIEYVERTLEPKVKDGDLRAIEVLVKLFERKAKLLGLDPAVGAITEGSVDAAIRELRKEVDKRHE